MTPQQKFVLVGVMITVCSVWGHLPSAVPDPLQRDYRLGLLTRETYLLYEIARLNSSPLLPGKYVTQEPLKCATHLWRLLMESEPFLSPSARRELSAVGVNFSGRFPVQERPKNLDKNYEPPSGFFLVHYTTEGTDGVDPTDLDEDGHPDYVNRVAEAFVMAFSAEVDSFGLVPPPGDGWYADNGGTGQYDIYVHNLGPNYYGETVPEKGASGGQGDNENSSRTEQNALTSYIGIRNDFRGFAADELESIQVTAAHEFFHAIQFGYDGWESIWMLEATATWVEDEVFDDINDNYQYLKVWLQQPNVALNTHQAPHWYGSWIFFRYLSEHVGGAGTIRKIFEESVNHNSYHGDFSIQTIDRVLARVGSGFSQALSSMVIANEVLSSSPGAEPYTYEEADGYRQHGVQPAYKASVVLSDSSYALSSQNQDLDPNASHYLELVPASGPIDVSLFPESHLVEFQVKAILQRTSEDVTVYDIGKFRNITVPNDMRRLTIAVISDTTEGANYGYTMKLEPWNLLPSRITLFQNFPNPFNEMTTFRFFLPEVDPVSLVIYDLTGRQVGRPVVKEVKEGFNDTRFQARHLPSGVYVLRLEAEGEVLTRKFTLVK